MSDRANKSLSGQPKSGARLSSICYKDNLDLFLISSTGVRSRGFHMIRQNGLN